MQQSRVGRCSKGENSLCATAKLLQLVDLVQGRLT